MNNTLERTTVSLNILFIGIIDAERLPYYIILFVNLVIS
jgi:hypothetical protein